MRRLQVPSEPPGGRTTSRSPSLQLSGSGDRTSSANVRDVLQVTSSTVLGDISVCCDGDRDHSDIDGDCEGEDGDESGPNKQLALFFTSRTSSAEPGGASTSSGDGQLSPIGSLPQLSLYFWPGTTPPSSNPSSSFHSHTGSFDGNHDGRVAHSVASTAGSHRKKGPGGEMLQRQNTRVSGLRPEPGLDYVSLPVWAAALLVASACIVTGLVWFRLIYYTSVGHCQDEVWKHHCVQPTYPVLVRLADGKYWADTFGWGNSICTCHTVRFQRGDEYV